jgi:hypothetical protein
MSNLRAQRTYTCFGDNQAAQPGVIAFNVDEVQCSLDTFCNSSVKNYPLTKTLNPQVFKNDIFVGLGSQLTDTTKDVAYYVGAHPDSFATGRELSAYFEGLKDNDKLANCAASYNDLIKHVRLGLIRMPTTQYQSATVRRDKQ